MTGRTGVPGGLELGMLAMVLCAPHPGSSQDVQQTSCSDISVLRSVEILLSCATTGDELAQFSLGLMYESGLGVPEDDVEAVRWYRLAAVELSRFSGRVNTEVYSLSPSLGRGKLPPRSGGVKGNLATQVSHAAAPWRRSKLMGDS